MIYTTEILKYGTINSSDRYWTLQKIFQVINKAIPIFENAYPGHTGVFAFDIQVAMLVRPMML